MIVCYRETGIAHSSHFCIVLNIIYKMYYGASNNVGGIRCDFGYKAVHFQ